MRLAWASEQEFMSERGERLICTYLLYIHNHYIKILISYEYLITVFPWALFFTFVPPPLCVLDLLGCVCWDICIYVYVYAHLEEVSMSVNTRD